METTRLILIIEQMEKLSQEFFFLLKILVAGTHPTPSQTLAEDNEEMTRLQVIKYLGICERTYIRRVKDGTLKPRKLPGGDRFYKRDLDGAYKESIRRGRV
ncbi:hypothetical protein SAMN04489864_109152 [Pedobacter insulae]|uniref:Helix-turn-helix domain-containing protein n=1 Tax=Pedobacter insulae TaxID=414048 RepID=A0A1I2ZCB2_9SPHI|nr:hypothetical protein SAMN04489864_109152 [Pedobacter insulae]